MLVLVLVCCAGMVPAGFGVAATDVEVDVDAPGGHGVAAAFDPQPLSQLLIPDVSVLIPVVMPVLLLVLASFGGHGVSTTLLFWPVLVLVLVLVPEFPHPPNVIPDAPPGGHGVLADDPVKAPPQPPALTVPAPP